jgi:hypothetical protein
MCCVCCVLCAFSYFLSYLRSDPPLPSMTIEVRFVDTVAEQRREQELLGRRAVRLWLHSYTCPSLVCFLASFFFSPALFLISLSLLYVCLCLLTSHASLLQMVEQRYRELLQTRNEHSQAKESADSLVECVCLRLCACSCA